MTLEELALRITALEQENQRLRFDLRQLKDDYKDLWGQTYTPSLLVKENGKMKKMLTLRGMCSILYKKVFYPTKWAKENHDNIGETVSS